MIEVALCLAIIGFALVSILAVLPVGMNNQQKTRQSTLVSQDATMLLEAIRNGARGMDDLTNYVFAITNYVSFYNDRGKLQNPVPYAWGYAYGSAAYRNSAVAGYNLTNGARIVGTLSTPEFTAWNGQNTASSYQSGSLPLSSIFNVPYTSNRVYAYVRSLSGLAAEKPPQNNDLLRGSSFSYQVLCVNAPVANDPHVMTNAYSVFDQQLAGNLRHIWLLFRWPLLPNSSLPLRPERLDYRADVAGTVLLTNDYNVNQGMWLYFYQSQQFTNTP